MNGKNSIQKTEPAPLAQTHGAPEALKVGQLEAALLDLFPAQDACSWDHTGMLAGFPEDDVTGVAVALDPTIAAFEAAREAGANVLVTHHPLFIGAPQRFLPASAQGEDAGSRINHLLSNRMSCLSFHTACDVSREGLAALPALLRLKPLRPLDPLPEDAAKGLGMVCEPDGESLDVRHLAARCVSVFGSHPRVWGNQARRVSRICTFGGSAGDALALCREQGIDCLVCGELKYHDALDAASSGLSIIELGHDVSEHPLVAVLASAVVSAGVDGSCVTMVNQKDNWVTPEALRR